MIFIKTLNIKRYSSHNFQDIVTSFGHKVDRTISMLTRYRFFDKYVLRGFIDKIDILSINHIYLVSKGGDDILKIVGGVVFYVERYYETY